MIRTTIFRRAVASLAAAAIWWTAPADISAQVSGVGEAMISRDPETRQLIIVADDDTHERIREVLARLDRPVPQVLIRVVFLEVTYRKGLDIGVEGSYQRRPEGSSVEQIFGLRSQGASPTTPIFTGTGAGMYEIARSDFQAMLRAIAEAGRTEVLSRPTILTRNNQQAVITVGKQVPLISGVRFDTFGNQINIVSYQDVGIILRVIPYITNDGMIEMVVSPEISALDEQTVSISEGVNAPVINLRAADTVVVTPDGQTVVIGGLMENNKTVTERKIPLLGDIPVLGNLFKRRISGDVKTELLIFLTPYIVREPAHLAGITADERSATQMIPKSFTEQELNRFFDIWEEDPYAPQSVPPPAPQPALPDQWWNE